MEEYAPIVSAPHIEEALLNNLPEDLGNVVKDALKKSTEKCVWLDWRSSKDEQGDITFLACDSDFSNHLPEFFKPIPRSRTYTSFRPFDISLLKIFEPYLKTSHHSESTLE